MNKPKHLKDLIRDGMAGNKDVDAIARHLFDGMTTGTFPSPEGYIITAAAWDDLPEPTRQFVRKAIGFFTVENIFDAKAEVEEPDVMAEEDYEEDGDTE